MFSFLVFVFLDSLPGQPLKLKSGLEVWGSRNAATRVDSGENNADSQAFD